MLAVGAGRAPKLLQAAPHREAGAQEAGLARVLCNQPQQDVLRRDLQRGEGANGEAAHLGFVRVDRPPAPAPGAPHEPSHPAPHLVCAHSPRLLLCQHDRLDAALLQGQGEAAGAGEVAREARAQA